jgi:hypothetical protein
MHASASAVAALAHGASRHERSHGNVTPACLLHEMFLADVCDALAAGIDARFVKHRSKLRRKYRRLNMERPVLNNAEAERR